MAYDVESALARLTSPYKADYSSKPSLLGTETVALPLDYLNDERPSFDQAQDSGANGLHATKIDLPTCVVGRYGGATRFDGVNDALSIAHNVAMSATNKLSFIGQFTPEPMSAHGYVAWKTGTLKLQAGVSGAPKWRAELFVDGAWRVLESASGKLRWNEEQTVAVTYDGATIKLNIDGVDEVTTAQTGALGLNESAPLLLGYDGTDDWYLGAMRDVRFFWGVGLTGAQITTIRGTAHPSNNAKLMQAYADGFWALVRKNLSDMRKHMYLATMEGGSLDEFAKLVSLKRGAGESDAAFRLRIRHAIRKLFGANKPDDMIEFTASLLGANPEDIELIENEASSAPGVYKPAYLEVKFDVDLLGALGFDPSEYNTVIASLASNLTDVAAAGVKVGVYTLGGAQFDVESYDVGRYGQ